MPTNKEREMFIKGMECAIEWIRKDMSGGALRQFDLHTWKILDYIKQAKIINSLRA